MFVTSGPHHWTARYSSNQASLPYLSSKWQASNYFQSSFKPEIDANNRYLLILVLFIIRKNLHKQAGMQNSRNRTWQCPTNLWINLQVIYNLPLKIASVTSKSLWHLSERPYILDGIYIISSDRSLTNPLIFSMLEGSHTLRNRGRHRNTEERDSALNQRQQAGRQRGASLLDELLNEGPTPTRWENSAE